MTLSHVLVIAASPRETAPIRDALRRLHVEEVSCASYGDEALLTLIDAQQPGIVILDASAATDEAIRCCAFIIQHRPIPLVLLTPPSSLEDLRRHIEANALPVHAVLEHPGYGNQDWEQTIRSLQLLSEVKVIRRRGPLMAATAATVADTQPHEPHARDARVVVVGASAGGTKALQEILSRLPADFSLPMLVVQHIAGGYIGGLARWLSDQSALRIVVARHDEELLPATVYLAPDDRHLVISNTRRIALLDQEPVNGFRPSISMLFASAAEAFGGACIPVLLSGMGTDGAAEMRVLHQAGARTIAQDKESSLIHGIPGEAIKLGAVRYVLPIQHIASALHTFAQRGTVFASQKSGSVHAVSRLEEI
ncbi:MAG TPA: chemotaxis protein CheB [Bacteroidota bacterium]|nr:chemotaxis protein CheB [Bacteroidota bacterium]